MKIDIDNIAWCSIIELKALKILVDETIVQKEREERIKGGK